MAIESATIEGGGSRTVVANQFVYAGWWPRLGAHLLDLVVVVPYALGMGKLMWSSRYGFAWNLIGGTGVTVLYLYCIVRFGGTPGKLILKLRILNQDGSRVGYRGAILRNLVMCVYWDAQILGLLLGAMSITDAEYAAISSGKHARQHLEERAPAWYQPVETAASIWLVADVVCFFANKKRRALHDFMGGTVVVRLGKVTE